MRRRNLLAFSSLHVSMQRSDNGNGKQHKHRDPKAHTICFVLACYHEKMNSPEVRCMGLMHGSISFLLSLSLHIIFCPPVPFSYFFWGDAFFIWFQGFNLIYPLNRKSNLWSICIFVFLAMNTLKQEHSWIHFDKFLKNWNLKHDESLWNILHEACVKFSPGFIKFYSKGH